MQGCGETEHEQLYLDLIKLMDLKSKSGLLISSGTLTPCEIGNTQK